MKAPRRCVIYARISVSSEKSVSIDRQIEAAEQYAAARGWKVVGVFRDDGVSATKNRPEARAGWRALLDSTEKFDAVIIWKLDRLARRVLDFHLANETLKGRGAGLVAVENTIDMTTGDGRMIAGVLANFAEYEADAISTRVKAARDYLLREGRVVGGAIPYGWRSISNPDPGGKGYVLSQDPDRIEYVRGMVERVQHGGSIYSVKQWLDEAGVPLPNGSQKHRKTGGWSYNTIERLLRNPVLAGRTAFNPGNESKSRGLAVLRGEDGLPRVGGFGIMTGTAWRLMVKQLDERDSAQSQPRALKGSTSPLLSGLVWCEPCRARMHRGTTQGRPGYSCPKCYQVITNFEGAVVAEFLRQKGEHPRWSVVEDITEGGEQDLPEIALLLAELAVQRVETDDDDEVARLNEQIDSLRVMRREVRSQSPVVVQRYFKHGVEEGIEGTAYFAQDWAAAKTVEDQRAVLGDALERVWVRRGRLGRSTPASVLARLTFDWKQPEDLGPLEQPDDATLASWAE